MKISTNQLFKQYQNHIALNNINLNIPSGSICGLLGPNGAGKTSLIRILTQITQPDKGCVFFNDELINQKHIKAIGYLPEERGLYKKMTVGEQLLFFAQLKGLTLVQAKKELKKWCEKLDIVNLLPKKTEELSKGMQQKIQFVATVINNPMLLILDEPFSGFDPINAQIIINEIKELNKNGTTIIFSTHRMESVELLCDYIILLNKSNKILEGELKEIKKSFKKNEFKVGFANGTLPHSTQYQIINQNNDNNLFILKPIDTLKNNDFIQLMMNSGLEITHFEELLPTIEDIFINCIKNNANE